MAVRGPRKTVVVFCEGRRSEPEYLEALKREPDVKDAAAVDLRIERRATGSVPLTLVRLAIDARERSEREEGEIDEFWCVFDVEWPENHPNLREAMDLAARHGIRLAVSNPCFELWLVLHFRDCRAWLDNDAARRLRRACDGQVDKGVAGGSYMMGRHLAVERAAVLDRMHMRNAVMFPHDNPSSGMHRLVTAVSPQAL
ncbi:RloB family protein [Phytohabitans flavus]|uniref:RloB family protein n=1 Tax=Phytohabitans flavus TaxID=1076124 RepID=UPI0018D66A19|nr:RloB family protein [Phytohabitans flavus]